MTGQGGSKLNVDLSSYHSKPEFVLY